MESGHSKLQLSPESVWASYSGFFDIGTMGVELKMSMMPRYVGLLRDRIDTIYLLSLFILLTRSVCLVKTLVAFTSCRLCLMLLGPHQKIDRHRLSIAHPDLFMLVVQIFLLRSFSSSSFTVIICWEPDSLVDSSRWSWNPSSFFFLVVFSSPESFYRSWCFRAKEATGGTIK